MTNMGVKNFVVDRLTKAPLKFMALLAVLLGTTIAVFTVGYLLIPGLFFVVLGLFIYFIDFLTRKMFAKRSLYLAAQYILSILFTLFFIIVCLQWQEHNEIVFPSEFQGQAGIIFGVAGYPKLPETKFWKKKIVVPANGIIITSTKAEELSKKVRFYLGSKSASFDAVDWDSNFDVDCLSSDNKIKGWLFEVGRNDDDAPKKVMTDLCNQIALGKTSSFYKSTNPVVWSDNTGKYLWLQNKGLTSLPGGLDKLGIYKAILTGNNFKEVPQELYKVTSLQDLTFAVNPISIFPCDLNRFPNLKSVSFAATSIREINCDLSQLESLTEIDLARNELSKVPEQIKTIPNLKELFLNDNRIRGLSFVDSRLGKLEVLYLYTNKVKSITKETVHLKHLKELSIFDNEIESIPDNISDLISLERLEIWNNPIRYISPNISRLKKLKSIRVDDNYLAQADKDSLKKWLPNCEVHYQNRQAMPTQ
ncbi:hypothetical protein DRJ53_16925 [Paracnuella aquatica]|nr:leucine-rich repeat domain-containing protein [Paracnuella aquatica]RPD44400.1 hypothetical protein DRJ53_16925 [Paracnuella aquatica]